MVWISMLMLQMVVVEYHGVNQHVNVTDGGGGSGGGISWCGSAC